MSEQTVDLPQETLDLLILRTLALEPQHGWAISERIHQVSSKVMQAHVLTYIADHPINRIQELLPWNLTPINISQPVREKAVCAK